MRNIWLYWENKPGHKKPEYLNLCLKSIQKNCGSGFDVKVLNEKSIYEYLPDLRPEIVKFPCLAHKADYIRARLLFAYGGVWLDSDMILLKSLESVFVDMNNSKTDFVGCGRTGNRPSIGFLASKSGCKLLELWICDMNIAIDMSNDYKFHWTEIGYDILWKHSATYQYHHYEFKKCIPIYSKWKEIFFSIDPAEKTKHLKRITDQTLMVYLYNAMFPASFKLLSEKEILDSDFFIADLFRGNI